MPYEYESLGSLNNTLVINKEVKDRLLKNLFTDLGTDGANLAVEVWDDDTLTAYDEDSRATRPANPLGSITVAYVNIKYAVSSTEKVVSGGTLDDNGYYVSDTFFAEANCVRVKFTLQHDTTDTDINFVALYLTGGPNIMMGYIADRTIPTATTETFHAYIKV